MFGISFGRARAKRKTFAKEHLGSIPGTIIERPDALPTTLTVFAHDEHRRTEQCMVGVADLKALRSEWPVVWVNVHGLGNAEVLTALGDEFDLHPLILEDVVNVYQRPKTELYDDTLFLVIRMAAYTEHLETEQIAFVIGKDYVITFQERPGDCLDPVRARIRRDAPRPKLSRADYLAYALLDSVVDHYFPVMERLGDQLEALEDRVLESADENVLEQIHEARRNLVELRRLLWPTREAIGSLHRDESGLIASETRVYLRDCYDHSVQLLDLAETYRDLSAALMESYRSQVSLKMNEVMQVLTVIATLFIPITFIAGIYGMNFNPEISPWNMPELSWFWGYPFALVLMLLTAAAFLWFFKRKGWIGRKSS